jgi:SAM-dependent methyltransferase
VRYVDLLPVDRLREMYPHFAGHWLVAPDVLDDAQTLATIADESQDFVIVNHVLEHMENPLGALRNWLRVVKPGGVVFMTIPDKRHTFDGERPETTIEHLLRDDTEGPEWSREAHYEEYARLAEHVPEPGVRARAADLAKSRQDIHFHVWTLSSLHELLLYLRQRPEFRFEPELVQANFTEVLVILRRT